MDAYLDTSALARLYYPEEETSQISRWVIQNNQSLPFSSLHEIELKNAVLLKVFRRELLKKQAAQISKNIAQDLNAGVLQRVAVNWGELFTTAIQLSQRHTPVLGNRSMDILHVSLALQMGRGYFMSFDQKQCRLAQKAGLRLVKLGH